MKSKIKNYTTDVPAHRSIAEIQQILIAAGATGIAMDYGPEGAIKALYFRLMVDGKELPFKLPAKSENVYKILHSDKRVMYGSQGQKQIAARKQNALNVTWRIVKDWLEVQLTLIKLEQAEAAEIFFPYLAMGDKTLYEVAKGSNFSNLLPSGAERSV